MAANPEITVVGAIAGAALGATLVHLYTLKREDRQKKEREKKIAFQIMVRIGWVVALSELLPKYLNIFIPPAAIEELKSKTTESCSESHIICTIIEEIFHETFTVESNKDITRIMQSSELIKNRIIGSRIILSDIMSITNFPKNIILINTEYNSLIDNVIDSIEIMKIAYEQKSFSIFGANEFHTLYRTWQDIQEAAEKYAKGIMNAKLVDISEYRHILAYHKSDIAHRISRSFADKSSLEKAKKVVIELAKDKAPTT